MLAPLRREYQCFAGMAGETLGEKMAICLLMVFLLAGQYLNHFKPVFVKLVFSFYCFIQC